MSSEIDSLQHSNNSHEFCSPAAGQAVIHMSSYSHVQILHALTSIVVTSPRSSYYKVKTCMEHHGNNLQCHILPCILGPNLLIISFSSGRFPTHHVGGRVLPLMQTTDKQTVESHSKHTVLLVKSTVVGWAAEKRSKIRVESISSQILGFFKLRQQLAIVQKLIMWRDTPLSYIIGMQ